MIHYRKTIHGSLLLILLALSFTLLSHRIQSAEERKVAEFWDQLGILKADGTEQIRHSFMEGFFAHWGANKAKGIPAANRGAVARQLLNYSRQYLTGPAFGADYTKRREALRPKPEVKKELTKEDIRKKEVDKLKKHIAGVEKSMKEATPENAKYLQPGLEYSRKQLADYELPDSKEIEALYQLQLTKSKQAGEAHERKLQQWNERLPADPSVLIKRRLQHYLTVAATVDFSAELVQEEGKWKFVNKEYERKPPEWKYIFRAGPEVHAVTTEFVRQWLKELP